MNVYRSMVENKILEQDDVIEKLKEEIQELNQKLQASEVKFREEISKTYNYCVDKIAEKYKKKQDFIKSEINEFMKLDLIDNQSKDNDIDQILSNSPQRLNKDRSISDLANKTAKQLKDEIKQRKQAMRDMARIQASSKIGLSKLVTSLEKQTLEDEKKIEILNHKLNQAAKEKQMFKQKYQTLKAKVKTNETDDIKLIKTISLETREKYNKSPFPGTSHKIVEPEKGGLRNLQQARKERKGDVDNTSREREGNLDMAEGQQINKNRTPRRYKKELKHKSSFDDSDPGKAMHKQSKHSNLF
jgi:chromosome segregation ATPase